MKYVEQYGEISNREAWGLLNLAESMIKRILKQMVQDGLLKERGERRTRTYEIRQNP